MTLDILKDLQVSVPFEFLRDGYLEKIISLGLNPEIGLDRAFFSEPPLSLFKEVALTCKNKGLRVTLHAPFTDLVPGSPDPKLREVTLKRLGQAFDLVELFGAKAIVCHLGYCPKRYHEGYEEWLDTSLNFWSALIERAEKTEVLVLFENVFEPTPQVALDVIQGLGGGKFVGACLDVGHARVFGEAMLATWLEKLWPHLKMLHLHDNDGLWDRHWGLGMGLIDFGLILNFIQGKRLEPIVTLEPHREDWLEHSLNFLKGLKHR